MGAQPTLHNMTRNPRRVSPSSSVVGGCQPARKCAVIAPTYRWDRQQRMVKMPDNPSSGSAHRRIPLHRVFLGSDTISSQRFVVESVRRVDFPARPVSFAYLLVSWERRRNGRVKTSHQPLVQQRGSTVQFKSPRECRLGSRDSCSDTTVHDCPNSQELKPAISRMAENQ